MANSRPIWISRCVQFDKTAERGITSRGTGTRLISPELSAREVVPLLQARLKKLNGTRPHKIYSAKFGTELFGKIVVKTKVKTPIIMRGFNRDQNTPNDIFRYLTRKSLPIRLN